MITENGDGTFGAGALEEREMPDELFLRQLVALDADDDDALLGFIESFGVPLLEVDPIVGGPKFHPSLLTHAGPEQATWQRFTLDAPRSLLAAIRAATLTWVAALDRDETEASLLAWAALDARAVTTPQTARRAMAAVINQGLRGIPARVRWIADEPHEGGPRGLAIDDSITLPETESRIDLFAGLCAQLAIAIDGDEAVRRCGNRRCRQLFIRQLGRARHGQHRRTGVSYCSPECARREGVRRYRDKKRQEDER